MTDTKTMLAQYNAIREQQGKKPLKAWKGSKQALADKITAEKQNVTPVTDEPETPKKKASKKSAPKATKGDDDLSVADIARELGINPKVARAKLRRKGKSADGTRWSTVKRDSKDHRAIVEILEG